jgi:hypothetical protein
VTDTTTNDSTYLGRMLIPLEWGRLSTTATMWTDRFTVAPTASCTELEYASGVFSPPWGNDGEVQPLSHSNRFEAPAECGSSRFTEFPNAIRHELGVRR